MRIKSFVASTVQEALSNIKEEMGESSIILETRNISDDDIKSESGQNLVEIVAAEIFAEKEVGNGEERKEEGCFCEEKHSLEGDPDGHLGQEITSLEVEWPESCKEWFSLLCKQQVESVDAKILVSEMLSELDKENIESIDEQREKIKEIITRKIKIYPLETFQEETNKTKVFIGASGIGKTTTLSKLARKTRLYSGNEIVLISIENDSVEKMNSVATEIGAVVAVVTTPQELKTVQDEFRRSTHMFIEMPGIGGNDNKKLLALREYINAIPNSEIHLVLNATTRLKDISTLVFDQEFVPIHGLLFTKTDEADTFGTLLTVIMRSEIPVSYIANGNTHSGDIKPATANMIAEMILN
ncbi:MAG: hypothetical protein D8M57_02790 [Candidatus Scalindua sp. AMX11]|nr:MAG: hypothetical protein DWQ00_17200 [Candidatus Scalindua sp.]NOG85790.1 hypothetical protein [Planctomycetota bacterium]RZV97034.1 MAG: hypothetical protein EX341_02270 [Candidatus Scalindua sp. SCAELEC01]TDE66352.1 MAG: hypothetical protein D8M57_02790 [Candidatus Scalindua sp. AMX11]GJQ58256.1 MAG: flagellar biosynthesis regulator FlhF [Candidatus Scalindua sp.]